VTSFEEKKDFGEHQDGKVSFSKRDGSRSKDYTKEGGVEVTAV